MKYDDKALLFSISLLKALRVQDNMPAINASPELLPTFGVDDLYISENEAYVRIHLNSYGTKKNRDIMNKKETLNLKEIEVFHMKCVDN